MGAAVLACVVDVKVAVGRGKALALKFLALADNAPAATLDYLQR